MESILLRRGADWSPKFGWLSHIWVLRGRLYIAIVLLLGLNISCENPNVQDRHGPALAAPHWMERNHDSEKNAVC